MKFIVVLCRYDVVLRSEEEDHVFIRGAKMVVLVDGDVLLIYLRVRQDELVVVGPPLLDHLLLEVSGNVDLCPHTFSRRFNCYIFIITTKADMYIC